ncbi:hypothetical protein LCGC14_0594890 [marine sediment metagenome]|uniref:KTSC domain-containing protein n=1 Tax=marine sediment metagenome TaxID=412755 RepID=A0A0F9TYI4_9ZZZZ
MDRIPVSSSNIASIGYDENQMVLEVEFLNGRIYHYEGVPEYVFKDFLNSGSKGSFFHSNIRNTYPYSRVL